MRFKLPTLGDLIIVGGLFALAAALWCLDPKYRHSPYEEEADR